MRKLTPSPTTMTPAKVLCFNHPDLTTCLLLCLEKRTADWERKSSQISPSFGLHPATHPQQLDCGWTLRERYVDDDHCADSVTVKLWPVKDVQILLEKSCVRCKPRFGQVDIPWIWCACGQWWQGQLWFMESVHAFATLGTTYEVLHSRHCLVLCASKSGQLGRPPYKLEGQVYDTTLVGLNFEVCQTRLAWFRL